MNNSLDNKKFRPYLTVLQMRMMMNMAASVKNSPAYLSMSNNEQKAILDIIFVCEDMVRKAERGTATPAVTLSTSVPNNKISGNSLFSEEELKDTQAIMLNTQFSALSNLNSSSPVKIKTDAELIDEMSEYEEDVFFTGEELKNNFITQEEYDIKIAKFKVKYNVKD